MRVEAEQWAHDHFEAIGEPICWRRYTDPVLAYRKIGDSLTVVVSGSTEKDGRRWLHVSASRPSKLPNWEDMREVKNTFIGRDRKAIQVLPPQAEYVNDHPYVLHLWACVDDDGLPDFRKVGPRGELTI
jgi:hypothetical protein